MKGFFRVFLALCVFSISVVILSSCSKKGMTHKFNAKRTQQSNYTAVSSKSEPIGKKFILKGKHKRILGQKKPL
jgi:hypothetical protein